ncbi:MAG: RAMP superfamily CRISPR-associated protein [Clostridia bacterium]|nr:RAMP superfamily CRISPR-associated protein [Clostridia bacterium]
MSIYYDFVEFLKPESYTDKKGELSGKLSLEIKTLAPVFVGSGYEEEENGLLYKAFQKYQGQFVIPGSSLKGVLRTISQAVSYSCVDVEKEIINDLPFQRCTKDNGCIVCRTYGKMDYKGSVSYRDFNLRHGQSQIIRIPMQMSPNIKKKDVYYKNGKLRGIKFYRHGDYRQIPNAEVPVQAVMPGAVFGGEIVFQEIHREQLELLCYSLGLDGSFQLKVGANKSGFFGSCKIEVKNAFFIQKDLTRQAFDACEYARNYRNNDDIVKKNKQKLSEILSISKQ